jgi:Putative prokaryotic signal transducing protein
MLHCPQCLAEYREGFTRCPDCDMDLEPGAPPEDAVESRHPKREFDPHDVPEMTTVFVSGSMEAEIVRALLESHDIPALVRGSGIGAYPVNVGAMGTGEVRVPVDRREEALEVIASSHHGP